MIASSLPPQWSILLYGLIFVFIVLLFVFYNVRFMGFILTQIVHFYWGRRRKIYFNVESLKVSFLAGKILFKNVWIYDKNMSLHLLEGYVCFRYWLLRVRQRKAEDDEQPCHFSFHCNGFEWFIYNRTAAYENIAQLIQQRSNKLEAEEGPLEEEIQSGLGTESDEKKPPLQAQQESIWQPGSWLFQILPLEWKLGKGAIMIGNEEFKSLIVAKFSSATGVDQVLPAKHPLDLYRRSRDLQFEKAEILFLDNIDFQEPEMNADKAAIEHSRSPHSTIHRFTDQFTWESLPRFFFFKREIGLDKDLEMLNNIDAQLKMTEYAKVANLLSASIFKFKYYYDKPGLVPINIASTIHNNENESEIDIGNGDLPPEYGVDIVLHNAVINYGPWADRQRISIQEFFFPNTYEDSVPEKQLKTGERRKCTAFKLNVQLEGNTTHRLPTRESSKDWKYNTADRKAWLNRSYGWMEFKIGPGSNIKYVLPLVSNENGCTIHIDVEYKSLSILTSVNFATLLATDHAKLQCRLYYPLKWNGKRLFKFNIFSDSPNIYFLRDHQTLLVDIASDWTTGPNPDLLHFIPFDYFYELDFLSPKFFLCINERNIIDRPNDLDDNTFIILDMEKATGIISMDFAEFNRASSFIHYNTKLQGVKGSISFPLSSTTGNYLIGENSHILDVDEIIIDGSLVLWHMLRKDLVDTLVLNINGRNVYGKLFGFLVRSIVFFKNNYFGDHEHFVTLDEYRNRMALPEIEEEVKRNQFLMEDFKISTSNPLEVVCKISFENSIILLPEYLYSYQKSSMLMVHEFLFDTRNTHTYQDLYIRTSPLIFRLMNDDTMCKKMMRDWSPKSTSNESLVIYDFTACALRLYGPLPRTLPYKSDVNFNIGVIGGEVSPGHLTSLLNWGRSFFFHFEDHDNSLFSNNSDVMDLAYTIANVSLGNFNVALLTDKTRTTLCLGSGIRIHLDTLIDKKHHSHLILSIPTINICSSVISDINEAIWIDICKIDTAIRLDYIMKQPNWQDDKEAQKEFIREQDANAKRCIHLYGNASLNNEREFFYTYLPSHRDLSADDLPIIMSSKTKKRTSKSLSAGIIMSKSSSDYKSTHELIYLRQQCNMENTKRRENVERDLDRLNMPLTLSEPSRAGNLLRECLANISRPSCCNLNFYQKVLENKTHVRCLPSANETPIYYYRCNNIADYLCGFCEKNDEFFMSCSDYSAHLNPFNKLKEEARIHNSRSKQREKRMQETSLGQKKAEDDDQRSQKSIFSVSRVYAQPILNTDLLGASSKGKTRSKMSYIIVNIVKPMEIFLTPLIIQVMEEFLDLSSNKIVDHQTIMDMFHLNYLNKIVKRSSGSYNGLQCLLFLKEISIDCIQEVARSNYFGHLLKNGKMPTSINAESFANSICCRVSIDLKGTVLSYLISSRPNDLKNHIGLMRDNSREMNENLSGSYLSSESTSTNNLFHVGSSSNEIQRLIESEYNFSWDSAHLRMSLCSPDIERRIFGLPSNVSNTDISSQRVLYGVVIKKTRLFASLSSSKCKEDRIGNFTVDVGSVTLETINRSVEFLLGSIHTWLNFMTYWNDIIGVYTRVQRYTLQLILVEIGKYSSSLNAKPDPIFLTRPSNLWRLGERRFQDETGWKLLHHIRNCLFAILPTPETLLQKLSSIVQSPISSKISNELFLTVVRALSNWRYWELGDICQCDLLVDSFGQHSNAKIKMLLHGNNSLLMSLLLNQSNCIKLRLEEIELLLYDENVLRSHVNVHNIIFDCVTNMSNRLLPEANETTGSDSDPKQTRILEFLRFENNRRAYSDVTDGPRLCEVYSRIHIQSVKLNFDPYILAFIRHVTRVMELFDHKLVIQTCSQEQGLTMANSPSLNHAEDDSKVFTKAHGFTKSVTHSLRTSNILLHQGRMSKDSKDSISESLIVAYNRRQDLLFSIFTIAEVSLLEVHIQAISIMADLTIRGFTLTSEFCEKSFKKDITACPPSSSLQRLARMSHSTFFSISKASADISSVHPDISIQKDQCYTIINSHLRNLCIMQTGGHDNHMLLYNQGHRYPKSIGCYLEEVIFSTPNGFKDISKVLTDWKNANMHDYKLLSNFFSPLDDKIAIGRLSTTTSSQSDRSRTTLLRTNSPNIKIDSNSVSSYHLSFNLLNFSLKCNLLEELQVDYEAKMIFFDLSWVLNFVISHDGQNSQYLPNGDLKKFLYKGQLKKQNFRLVSTEIHSRNRRKAEFSIPPIKILGYMDYRGFIEPITENHTKMSESLSFSKMVLNEANADLRMMLPQRLSSERMTKVRDLSMEAPRPLILRTGILFEETKLNISADMLKQVIYGYVAVKQEINNITHTFCDSFPKHLQSSGVTNSLSNRFLYALKIHLRGVQLMVSTPSVIMSMEAYEAKFKLSDGPGIEGKEITTYWHLAFESVNLSLWNNWVNLSRRVSLISADISDPKNSRLAHIDIVAYAKKNGRQKVEIEVSKLHAIMQPPAISKLVDLVVFYQKEFQSTRSKPPMTHRSEASESSADVISTLFFQAISISVKFENVAVSIPIVMDIGLPVRESQAESRDFRSQRRLSASFSSRVLSLSASQKTEIPIVSREALSFSIGSLTFKSSKGFSRGAGIVKSISIMFVENFDQKEESHFIGKSHTQINVLSLPSIEVCFSAELQHSKAKLDLKSIIHAYEIIVDTRCLSYIQKFQQIWQMSYKKISLIMGSEISDSNKLSGKFVTPNICDRKIPVDIVTFPFNFDLSSEIGKGVVKYIIEDTPSRIASTNGKNLLKGEYESSVKFIDISKDEILIPSLRLWSKMVFHIGERSQTNTSLVPDVNHHEIYTGPHKNIIYPSFATFVQKSLVKLASIRKNFELTSESFEPENLAASIDLTKRNQKQNQPLNDEHYQQSWSVFVYISPAILQLSCAPYGKVISSFELEESYSLMTYSVLSALQSSFSVSLIFPRTKMRLYHSFSPEDCLNVQASQVNIYIPVALYKSNGIKISPILDIGDISGQFNIRHLHDYFMFEKIWLRGNKKEISRMARNPRVPSQKISDSRLPVHIAKDSMTTAVDASSSKHPYTTNYLAPYPWSWMDMQHDFESSFKDTQAIENHDVSKNEHTIKETKSNQIVSDQVPTTNDFVFLSSSATFYDAAQPHTKNDSDAPLLLNVEDQKNEEYAGFDNVFSNLDIRIRRVDLLTDLSQTIGKATVIFSNWYISLNQRRQRRSIGIFTDFVTAEAKGRLTGTFHVSDIQFISNCRQGKELFFNSKYETPHEISLFVKNVMINIDYNLEKIFIFDIKALLLQLKDAWKAGIIDTLTGLMNADVEINVSAFLNSMQVILTRETLPSLAKLVDRIKILISEKISLTRRLVSEAQSPGSRLITPQLNTAYRSISGLNTSTSSISTLDSASLEHVNQLTKNIVEFLILAFKRTTNTYCINPRGHLSLSGGNVSICFFPTNFFDAEWAKVGVQNLLIELVEVLNDNENNIQRELTLQAGMSSIRKFTHERIDTKEKRSYSTTQWLEFTSSGSSKSIFLFPSLIFFMETYQSVDIEKRNFVRYKLLTDFGGAIDVTLNISFYTFLKQLIQQYANATLNKENPTRKEKENENTKKDQNLFTSKLESVFIFEAIFPMQMEPQLKALGEATPRLDKILEWIGISRESIPRSLYEGIILSLEPILWNSARILLPAIPSSL